MKNLQVIRITRSFKGYGHNLITITLDDGRDYGCVSTNTMAIDAFFDEFYDDEDNEGRYYESRKEAAISLVNEVLLKNEITDDFDLNYI